MDFTFSRYRNRLLGRKKRVSIEQLMNEHLVRVLGLCFEGIVSKTRKTWRKSDERGSRSPRCLPPHEIPCQAHVKFASGLFCQALSSWMKQITAAWQGKPPPHPCARVSGLAWNSETSFQISAWCKYPSRILAAITSRQSWSISTSKTQMSDNHNCVDWMESKVWHGFLA